DSRNVIARNIEAARVANAQPAAILMPGAEGGRYRGQIRNANKADDRLGVALRVGGHVVTHRPNLVPVAWLRGKDPARCLAIAAIQSPITPHSKSKRCRLVGSQLV